jgi:hypothetical protein
MKSVATCLGFKPNKANFILSPFSHEKTASCKLYENSFYDFSTNQGGDLIKFTALVLNSNNWQACQYLVKEFGLPIALSGQTTISRREIKRKAKEQQQRQEREQLFRDLRIEAIDSLKYWEDVYKIAIEKEIFSRDSEMHTSILAELQTTSYKLDVLCGVIGSEADARAMVKQEFPFINI